MPFAQSSLALLTMLIWTLSCLHLSGQVAPAVDSLAMIDTLADTDEAIPSAWYDTLEVTRPQYAVLTDQDRLYLGLFTAATLPLQFAFTMATIAPPSLGVVRQDGVARGTLSFATGVGFGRRQADELFWPEGRVQIEWTRFLDGDAKHNWKVTVARDWPLISVSSHDLFWLGPSVGIGGLHNGVHVQPFVQGMISFMNPMGITYLMLFPMHNWGLRGRWGWDSVMNRSWYEVAIGGEATFWF